MKGGDDQSIGDDPRLQSAWRSWLSALASDAQAAVAAALAYESLPDKGRDAWLDALDADASSIDVPRVALYAPLLAVESQGDRRARIETILASEPPAMRSAHALRGVGPDGTHACVVVLPLYLDFVRLLVCRYTPSGGFRSVRHEPMRHADDVRALREIDGVTLEPESLRVVVEELAHAVLADKREHRSGAAATAALAPFAHLFGP